jgi:hypothetical protein
MVTLRPDMVVSALTGGGTPHKPPVLDKEGFVIHESTSCAEYLIQHVGIPATSLLKEVMMAGSLPVVVSHAHARTTALGFTNVKAIMMRALSDTCTVTCCTQTGQG